MNQKTNAVLSVFEVTAAGFNGSSDVTDDHVFWILAASKGEVLAAIDGLGLTLHESLPNVSESAIDFRLPNDWLILRAHLAPADSLIGKLSRAHLVLQNRFREANAHLIAEVKGGQRVAEDRVLECIRLRTQADLLFWAMEMLPAGLPTMSYAQERERATDESLSREISEARDLFQSRIAAITAALANGDLSIAQFPRVGEEAVAELTESVSVLRDILRLTPNPGMEPQVQQRPKSASNLAKPLVLVPHGRFIRDAQNRMIAEMYQPGDSVAEQEAIKRRIVGSFNVLPHLIGVLLRANKDDGAVDRAMDNEGISDSYDNVLAEAVQALGDAGLADAANRYELDPESILGKFGRV